MVFHAVSANRSEEGTDESAVSRKRLFGFVFQLTNKPNKVVVVLVVVLVAVLVLCLLYVVVPHHPGQSCVQQILFDDTVNGGTFKFKLLGVGGETSGDIAWTDNWGTLAASIRDEFNTLFGWDSRVEVKAGMERRVCLFNVLICFLFRVLYCFSVYALAFITNTVQPRMTKSMLHATCRHAR